MIYLNPLLSQKLMMRKLMTKSQMLKLIARRMNMLKLIYLQTKSIWILSIVLVLTVLWKWKFIMIKLMLMCLTPISLMLMNHATVWSIMIMLKLYATYLNKFRYTLHSFDILDDGISQCDRHKIYNPIETFILAEFKFVKEKNTHHMTSD